MIKQTIAAFDFDGTLTAGLPSRLLFLKQLAGAPKILRNLMAYWKLKPGTCFRSRLLEWHYCLDNILVGRSKNELEKQALIFVEQILVKKLRKEALERLNFHQSQGHICVIVSGAWDIYLQPFAKLYHFNQIICTELEFDPKSDQCTGRMCKPYCLGNQKLDEFKKRYKDRNEYILYAYGDSSNDLPLLDYADYPFYRCFNN